MTCVAIGRETQTRGQKPHLMLAHCRSTRLHGLAPLILSLSLLSLSPQLHAAVACVSIDGGDPVCTEIPSPDPIILPGSGDGGGGGGGGGDGGLGGAGGGGAPGSSPISPATTVGASPDCPGDAHTREQRAMQQIEATIGLFGCIANEHQGIYYLVNFPGGTSGIYQGTGADCRGTHFANEIVAPSC